MKSGCRSWSSQPVSWAAQWIALSPTRVLPGRDDRGDGAPSVGHQPTRAPRSRTREHVRPHRPGSAFSLDEPRPGARDGRASSRSPPGWPPLPASCGAAPAGGTSTGLRSCRSRRSARTAIRCCWRRSGPAVRGSPASSVSTSSSAPRPRACRWPPRYRWPAGCRSRSSASRATAGTRSTNRGSGERTSRVAGCCSSTTRSRAARRSRRSPPLWPLSARRSLECSSSSTCATSPRACRAWPPTLPTESVSTYLEVLDLATSNGLLDPAVHELSVDALVNHWAEDDPRWELLPAAA